MQMRDHAEDPRRREFLQLLGASALGFAMSGGSLAAVRKPGPKPLRGVFPIGFTPITESDKLDLDCLAAEVKFCNRGRVHGFVWPQIASRWTTLTERERLDGAERWRWEIARERQLVMRAGETAAGKGEQQQTA